MKALPLYEKSCRLDTALGCRNAGVAYETADGVVANAAKARKLYESGCKLGDPASCAQARKLEQH